MKYNNYVKSLSIIIILAISLINVPPGQAQLFTSSIDKRLSQTAVNLYTKLIPTTIIRYVSNTGNDTSDCSDLLLPCQTVQYALNNSIEGDEIRLAEGTYIDSSGTVAVINKTLIISGGWQTDFQQRDPNANPSILNAQRNGSVIRLIGEISPVIDGLLITGGDASLNSEYPGKGGGIYGQNASPIIINSKIYDNLAFSSTTLEGFGGGIYLANALSSSMIQMNEVYSNTASTGYIGWGGGIYLDNSYTTVQANSIHNNISLNFIKLNNLQKIFPLVNNLVANISEVLAPPVETEQNGGGGIGVYGGGPFVTNNHIYSNICSLSNSGGGGGIYASSSAIAIDNNIVEYNFSSPVDNGVGGGIAVYNSTNPVVTNNTVRYNHASGGGIGKGGGIGLKWVFNALVSDNYVTENVSSTSFIGHGGGIFIKYGYDSSIINNTVISNTASTITEGQGGGIFSRYGDVTFQGNQVLNNTASTIGLGLGGGFFHGEGTILTFGNRIEGNTASISGSGLGGGVYMWDEAATMDANIIFMNTASLAGSGEGGGVYIEDCLPSILTNNFIIQNQASFEGGGIKIFGLKSSTTVTITNNTISDNIPGAGEGVFLKADAHGILTNNIISGQTTAIYAATPRSSASASYTLLYNNGAESGGPGKITLTESINGDPAFVDPIIGDYHIQTISAAIDTGDPRGVPPAPSTDIDGDSRPLNNGVDVGADEVLVVLTPMHVQDISLLYRAGSQRLTGQIQIIDSEGTPITGADVTVEWTYANGSTRIQHRLTNSKGLAIFRIRTGGSGTYMITVLDVVLTGRYYDASANEETSDLIVIP